MKKKIEEKANAERLVDSSEMKTAIDNIVQNSSIGKNNSTALYGVDQGTLDKMNTPYQQSEASQKADKNVDKALKWYDKATSGDMVSASTLKDINKGFSVPTEVTEADEYLKEQLALIQSGKTSYSDSIKNMMDSIMGRDKFSYDVDSDPLFQQALASAMSSGQQAMQDTIGQASALTGGYGSTYATSTANQAYNSFIEDAYDNLPQYYQMALNAYQMEGEEMYRQLGMLQDADSTEYNRNVTAYDATYQHRNQMYNEAYNQWRDSKADAFAMAGLEFDMYSQGANDAYNYLNATTNYANNMYNREYLQWQDSINQAMQYAQLLNNDARRGLEFAENQAQFDEKMALEYANLALETQIHNDNEAYRYTALAQSAMSGYGGGGGRVSYSSGGSSSKKSSGSSYKSSSGSGSSSKTKEPTETNMYRALEAYNDEGMDGYNKYLNSLPSNVDREKIHDYVGEYGVLPYSDRTYTVVDDGGINWFGGVDNNAVVEDQYGNQMTLKELSKIDKELAKKLSK